ncbi:MAG TPA: DUF4124 domain-containing protein [Methyloceanibacter sp.]|nr:DUF4124 domain-containing protein [Methyloceanibacter sp.]
MATIAIRLGFGFVLATVSPLAAAGVYKCARDDGTVMYQEDPCPAGKELRDFERDPASLSVIPFRIPNEPADPASPRKAAGSTKTDRPSRKSEERHGNPAERKFLVPGIGEGEVVARIGRPDVSSGAGRKTMRWTYLPVPEDPQTVTTLTFELGRLIQVERKVVPKP